MNDPEGRKRRRAGDGEYSTIHIRYRTSHVRREPPNSFTTERLSRYSPSRDVRALRHPEASKSASSSVCKSANHAAYAFSCARNFTRASLAASPDATSRSRCSVRLANDLSRDPSLERRSFARRVVADVGCVALAGVAAARPAARCSARQSFRDASADRSRSVDKTYDTSRLFARDGDVDGDGDVVARDGDVVVSRTIRRGESSPPSLFLVETPIFSPVEPSFARDVSSFFVVGLLTTRAAARASLASFLADSSVAFASEWMRFACFSARAVACAASRASAARAAASIPACTFSSATRRISSTASSSRRLSSSVCPSAAASASLTRIDTWRTRNDACAFKSVARLFASAARSAAAAASSRARRK